MPFKGDMRLGGRHSNVASLNGTASDFISVPAYGTVSSTLYQVGYPIANGGSYVTIDAQHANQVCDVDIINDGIGGTATDWSTARNITYISGGFTETGTHYGTISPMPYGNSLGVATYSFSSGSYSNEYLHDGAGGYQSIANSNSYSGQGTDIVAVSHAQVPSNDIQVPTGGAWFPSGYGDYTTFRHDGGGGYTAEMNFNYKAAGYLYAEYNEGQTMYAYEVGANFYTGRSEVHQYVADGLGGYSDVPTGTIVGNYYSAGIIFFESASGVDNATQMQVPSNYGSCFYPIATGQRLVWGGEGNYSYYTFWYFSVGTFITTDGTYNYYWDGSGGYYTSEAV